MSWIKLSIHTAGREKQNLLFSQGLMPLTQASLQVFSYEPLGHSTCGIARTVSANFRPRDLPYKLGLPPAKLMSQDCNSSRPVVKGNLQGRLRGKHESEAPMAADLLQSVHSEALMVHTWERKRRILQDRFLDFEVAESGSCNTEDFDALLSSCYRLTQCQSREITLYPEGNNSSTSPGNSAEICSFWIHSLYLELPALAQIVS